MGYLEMDGVDDYIKTVSAITFDKIVVDAVWQQVVGTFQDYWSESSLGTYLQRTSGNVDKIASGMTAYVNGTVQTNNTAFVPTGTRCTVETDYSPALSSKYVLFCANGGGSGLFMQAQIYDVKIYNGATLVAHYDFTSQANISGQTVLDQSGNGNDATLNGGAPVWGGVASGTDYPVTGTVNATVATTGTPSQDHAASGNSAVSVQASSAAPKQELHATITGNIQFTVSAPAGGINQTASGTVSFGATASGTPQLAKTASGIVNSQFAVDGAPIRGQFASGTVNIASWTIVPMASDGNAFHHNEGIDLFGLV